jgi:hypothetical protein
VTADDDPITADDVLGTTDWPDPPVWLGWLLLVSAILLGCAFVYGIVRAVGFVARHVHVR